MMKKYNLTPTEAELLQEVRDFKSGLLRRATYGDYEKFKQKFISFGCYGWEIKISDILEV